VLQVLKQCLAIGVAGFLGALARFFVGNQFQRLVETNFPLGTLIVNVTGCFILGFFATLVDGRLVVSETTRLAIAVGFVGAYTTFSTLMWDCSKLSEDGQFYKAGLNLLLSLAIGLIAVRLGVVCAKRF
jgi:CrcB protein